MDEAFPAWLEGLEYFPDRQFMPLDVQRSTSWLLLHQPLFHNYAHHDAGGQLSWILVLSGEKMFTFIRPRSVLAGSTRHDLHVAVTAYQESDCSLTGYYGEESERHVVFAKEGDLMYVSPRFEPQPQSHLALLVSASSLLGVSTKYTPQCLLLP